MINRHTEKNNNKSQVYLLTTINLLGSRKQNRSDFQVSHKYAANFMKIKGDRERERINESQAGKKREH